ncbi:MAG: hypothetical protein Q7R91_03105 [bacterium]|nr:hypothetical protein [bacterium]
MNHLNPSKTGLVFGALAGGWHLLWSLLVVLGWAQPLLNFIFMTHMITPPFVVGVFSTMTAVILIAVTAVLGYVVGNIFALVWNRFQK